MLLSPTHQTRYSHTYVKRDLRGLPLEADTQSGKLHYRWDALGRRLELTSASWAETIPLDGYDASGNLCHSLIVDAAGSVENRFSYNHLHQLEQERGAFSHAFLTDSLHNRLSADGRPHQHNTLNQLLSDGTSSYTYDLSGNLILKKTGDQHVHYRYDALNRLTEVTQDLHLSVQFNYDALNRRTAKKTFQWVPSTQSWKLIAQLHFLHDEQNEIGSTDITGKIVELRVLAEGMGAEIGSAIAIELDNTLYTPIHDHRGALTALIDPHSKKIVECYRYSAFGEEQIFNSSGQKLNESALGNPWRFSSKRIDDETGLVYFGRRYYDPYTGRWITADPQGYIDGPNLYIYLSHDPINHVDPFGLAAHHASQSFDFVRSCSRIANLIRNYFETGFKNLSHAIETVGRHTGIFPLVSLGRAMRGDINKPCYFTEYSRNFSIGRGEIHSKVRVSFQNGINTTYQEACLVAQNVSRAFGNVNVHMSHNASRGTLLYFF
jgi:RHS repeat-associated protein